MQTSLLRLAATFSGTFVNNAYSKISFICSILRQFCRNWSPIYELFHAFRINFWTMAARIVVGPKHNNTRLFIIRSFCIYQAHAYCRTDQCIYIARHMPVSLTTNSTPLFNFHNVKLQDFPRNASKLVFLFENKHVFDLQRNRLL